VKFCHLALLFEIGQLGGFSNSEIKVPVIPNCLSLNINPSCHILSKAFDTSRKIAHTSLPESRDL
jgi:hypothetical protein